MRTLRYANAVLGRLNLRDLARPHLEELVHEVGETATLSIPGEADAITVDFVPTDRYLQGVTRLGRPSVGHASSAGKVMLAFGDVVTPRSRLTAFTPRTITDPTALAAEIARVRERGYAEAIEEREVGLSAIAAPVWGADGELAAIVALQGPTSRFEPGRCHPGRSSPCTRSSRARKISSSPRLGRRRQRASGVDVI